MKEHHKLKGKERKIGGNLLIKKMIILLILFLFALMTKNVLSIEEVEQTTQPEDYENATRHEQVRMLLEQELVDEEMNMEELIKQQAENLATPDKLTEKLVTDQIALTKKNIEKLKNDLVDWANENQPDKKPQDYSSKSEETKNQPWWDVYTMEPNIQDDSNQNGLKQ